MKRMTPSSTPSVAAVIKAFAGIPRLLEQARASMARGRALDCKWLGGPDTSKDDLYSCRVDGYLRGRVGKIDTGACPRYIAPVLNEILEQSTTSTKQGAHV